MSRRKISKGTGRPTSSRGSAGGPSRSSSPDGPKTSPSGPDPAPANPSASQEKLEAWATRGTYGPIFIGSSPSAILQSSLGNRLRARMDGTGSPEYAMTWSEKDMPSGPPICALRASGRRNVGKGCTGWPTPTQDDPNNANRKSGQFQSLTRAAGWASPSARDWKDTPGMSKEGINPDGTKRTRLDQLPRQAGLVGWATPASSNAQAGREYTEKMTGKTLNMDASLAGWPTPMAGTPKTETYNEAGNTDSGRKTTELASGTTPKSSSAPTGSSDGFLLNHRFSLWLQGFPVEWASCGERVGRSSRKPRRNS